MESAKESSIDGGALAEEGVDPFGGGAGIGAQGEVRGSEMAGSAVHAPVVA